MSRPPTVWFSFSQAAVSGQAASDGRTREAGGGDGGVAAPADPIKRGQRADKIGRVERRLRKDFRVIGKEPRMNTNERESNLTQRRKGAKFKTDEPRMIRP